MHSILLSGLVCLTPPRNSGDALYCFCLGAEDPSYATAAAAAATTGIVSLMRPIGFEASFTSHKLNGTRVVTACYPTGTFKNFCVKSPIKMHVFRTMRPSSRQCLYPASQYEVGCDASVGMWALPVNACFNWVDLLRSVQ